jgi:hypothetical protein
VGAVATGGDFWKGATIGAMVGALNHTFNHLSDMGVKESDKSQVMLEKTLKSMKIGDKLSGEALKEIIPKLKGVSSIERISSTKFKIEPTFWGKTVISEGAYLEIRTGVSIEGTNKLDHAYVSRRTGVNVKIIGIDNAPILSVGGTETRNFVIVGNHGYFKVSDYLNVFKIK